MIGKLIINGIDAYTQYGVFLENGSYAKLLSGHNMKPYTTNASRLTDGVSVLMKNPRIEDRNVTLVFCFDNSGAPFLQRYESFLNMLRAGRVVGNSILPLTVETPELGKTFNLICIGDVNLSHSDLELGKVGVLFNEPNPANR